MSAKFTSLLAACAITTAVFAATAPAAAKDRPIVVTAVEEDVPVRYVTYRDLNLVEAAGHQTLVKRVRVAAKEVCYESVADGRQFDGAITTCRSEAWMRARPQIDRAVTRARDIAANGFSAIAPVAIAISAR